MKLPHLLLAAFVSLAAPLGAADKPNVPPAVDFIPFPLAASLTGVITHPGTPAGKATLDSPFPDDYPPHTTIRWKDEREYPAYKKGARYFIPATNNVTVYRIAELEKAPYKSIQHDLKDLRQLLKDRPKTVPLGEDRRSLPDYPPRNAAHTFQARLTYVDTPWGSGLFYLTQFSQEAHLDFANNETLTYVFQGVSKDGNFYVSADFRVTHAKLPAGIDAAPKKVDQDADTEFLEKEPEENFTPSLKKIREWVDKLEFQDPEH